MSGIPAVGGANVYPGDVLATQAQGFMLLGLTPDHILYLSGSTKVRLFSRPGSVLIKVDSGTIQFRSEPGQIEIETPLGMLRGIGTRLFAGQLTVLKNNEITVHAIKGTLKLFTNDGEKVIREGQAYRFVAKLAAAGSPKSEGPAASGPLVRSVSATLLSPDEDDYPQPVRQHHRKRKIAEFVIVGGTAIASYEVWNAMTVSPSTLSGAPAQ